MRKPWQEAISLWRHIKKSHTNWLCNCNKEGEIFKRAEIFDLSWQSIGRNKYGHADECTIRLNEMIILKLDLTYSIQWNHVPCVWTQMMNIRNISYGARDGFAGATSLNDKLDYIKGKNINIEYEGGEIEVFQLILQSVYEYERQHLRIENILSTWKDVNNLAIDWGKKLYNIGYFPQAVNENKSIEKVYNEVAAFTFSPAPKNTDNNL